MSKKLDQILKSISPTDPQSAKMASARQDQLTKPQGSLGRLEELSVRLASIKRSPLPRVADKAIITMAADHGVVAEGVSAYPQEVTAQMVYNFLRGGAAINVLARCAGARITVVDIGVTKELEACPGLVSKKVSNGTGNMAEGPAMRPDEAIRCVEAGIEILEEEISKGLDIVGTGDMGIGNTTASSAICSVMTGKPVEAVTGRGTGIDDPRLARKIGVIKKALAVNRPDPSNPLDVLAKVGGLEIGGLAGVMLAAAANHIPVVIDGFISGAAALIAVGLNPVVKQYLVAAHVSAEAGHRALLEHLGLEPLLDLQMRLGEGTGAALAIFLLEASARVLAEMATFEEAAVSGRTEEKE